MEARLEVVVAALRSGGGPFSGFKVPLEAPVSDGGLHAAREEAPKMLRRTGGRGMVRTLQHLGRITSEIPSKAFKTRSQW